MFTVHYPFCTHVTRLRICAILLIQRLLDFWIRSWFLCMHTLIKQHCPSIGRCFSGESLFLIFCAWSAILESIICLYCKVIWMKFCSVCNLDSKNLLYRSLKFALENWTRNIDCSPWTNCLSLFFQSTTISFYHGDFNDHIVDLPYFEREPYFERM